MINSVLDEFKCSGVDYITTTTDLSSLPYGIAVEAFYCGILRTANEQKKDPNSLEHVTFKFLNEFSSRSFDKYSNFKWTENHVSIDTIEDYNKVVNLFKGVQNPITQPWYEFLG